MRKFEPKIGLPLLRLQWSFFLLTLEARCAQLTIAWWTLTETGSIAQFSVMAGAAMAAEILAKPLLGWMGDTYCKIKLVRYGNLLMLVSATLTLWLSTIAFQPVWLALCMIVSGIVVGLRDPLQSSIIPELAPPAEITRAFQSKTMLWSIALVMGPGLAGLLLSNTSITSIFFLSVFLVLIASALVPTGASSRASRSPVQEQSSTAWPRGFDILTSGFSVVYRVRMERYLAIFSMAINFFLAPFFVLVVPFYVREAAGLAPWYAGLLDASFGVGILLGSRGVPETLKPKAPRDLQIKIGFFLLGINLLALGTGVNVWWLPLFFLLGGIGLVWINVNAAVVRSLATPLAYRNRLIATVAFISQCASPIGNLIVGGGVELYGAYITTTIAGSTLVLLVVLLNFVPDLSRIMRMPDAELPDVYRKIYPDAFN